ncbi:hypothetical protein ACCW76_19535 [Pantoea sp. C8B4]|uniref:hypothetical protein n=1 Tax=Pantoea sp. C8B4 TaxID=3243083 RepID=UPI003ED89D11
MSSSAYDHGIKAASVWKRLTSVYSDADSRFTAWAESKGIPVVIGKPLVPFSSLLLLAIVLIAGFAVSAVIIAAAAFVYMVRYIQLNASEDMRSASSNNSTSTGGQFRSGNNGDGFYSGPDDITVTSARLDKDEDDD